MAIELPGDVAYDIRQPIIGDSFNWAGVEPAAKKTVIDIHATASQAPGEDGFTMADYHVNHNGWGGIGVHFVVTKDSYPGRPQFGLPAGAQVQYVGDLLTWRAGVANNNPGRVHIEISGLFTPGNGVPSEAQLRLVRKLIDFLLAPNNILPSLNYRNQVKYHNQDAIQPDGATECPGWQHPKFGEWFGYLQGGPEPSWWTPAPPPAPEPTPTPAEPGMGSGQVNADIPVTVKPSWEVSWVAFTSDQTMTTTLADAPAVDVVSNQTLKTFPVGTEFQFAGDFVVNGVTYYRTRWATDNNKWNGIPSTYFAQPTVPSDGVQTEVTDQQLHDATVPPTPKITFSMWLHDLISRLISLLIKKGM